MAPVVWTTEAIRSSFLDFFKKAGHEAVSSSSLVPSNDPTLLFTNAGMVQFKDVFTGKEKRSYTRAATAQKCVRAGGKHNDLENVGYTARHHTFFEMLGNFSFGDYFKKEAIELAWNLVTEIWRIPKERLAVTVFKGEGQIAADEEAARWWQSVGVAKERIYWLGKADNYWQMGDTGPQGPCSEIHYYGGDLSVPGFDAVEKVERSEGWVEIWNLVFMQFVRDTKDGPIDRLPKPSIDTGAGLERLATVLQGKRSNYETDAFRPLIDAIAEELKKTYGGSMEPDDVSMRVIADHSRAAAFLIADGVQPSNDGRGYVLKRIMRRAIRHGSRLGFDDLFFHRACLRVVDRMKNVYPELERARALIGKVAESEETAFRRTLDNGLRLLEQEMTRAAPSTKTLDPKFIATLYDTYGFPIDLSRVIASERGFSVDEAAAQKAIEEMQGGRAGPLTTTEQTIDKVWFELREELGPTEFIGYERDDLEAKVLAIVAGGERADKAKAGDEVHVVLDRSPFYGESGGQVGDRGVLEWKGVKVAVKDTLKPRPDLIVHVGQVIEGTLETGARVEAKIDLAAREATRKNHSATHLLHLALKEVLGPHVQQKGSLVAPDRLRFDYAHFEPPTPEQIEVIERRVNAMVLANAEAKTEVGSIEQARTAGAVMLFGEKYGESVRMVRIGETLELCGGTHVRRSGDIGLVKIVSDGAIASGVRRMEAVTGMNALDWAQKQARLLGQLAGGLKTSPEALPERIDKLQKRTKELEKELERARADAAMGGSGQKSGGDLLDKATEMNGVKVLVHRADGTPIKSLREISDKLRDRLGSGVVILGATEEDKAALLVAVTKDLAGKVHAGNIVKVASEAMGGKGGGRPDFAQGGGKAELLDAGLESARAALQRS